MGFETERRGEKEGWPVGKACCSRGRRVGWGRRKGVVERWKAGHWVKHTAVSVAGLGE